MAKPSNHFIVILSGGSGHRLWPISRFHNPKQFLKLFKNKNLLEQTLTRARKICPSKNIFIISNLEYQQQTLKLIGNKIPLSNFIFEPIKKNTAMAIIFAINHIKKIDPEATITTMPSDHYIKQNLKFKKTINNSVKIANEYHQIVTIGIKPSFANPSFGYILPQQKNQPFSKVSLFIEKPSQEIAQNLIKKGALWNSSIHTFTIPDILSEFEQIQPEYIEFLNALESTNTNQKTTNLVYKKSPSFSLDKLLAEKSQHLLVISGNFGWNNMSEWNSVYRQLNKDQSGIATLQPDTQFIQIDSKNCLVSTTKNKIIGLIDVNNLAIIDTPDGLLVCNLAADNSFKVKEIVSHLTKNKKLKKYFI